MLWGEGERERLGEEGGERVDEKTGYGGISLPVTFSVFGRAV